MTRAAHRSDEGLRRAAADWVALVHDPDAAVDRAAFEQWRSADPRHPLAYARAERAWDRAGLLANGRFGRMPRQPAPAAWYARSSFRAGAAAAAMFAVVLVGLAVVLGRAVPPTTPPGMTLASRVGEVRRFALADGAIVTLDTDSEVQVPAGRDHRIVLVRGRARVDTVLPATATLIASVGTATLKTRDGAFDLSFVDGKASAVLLRGSATITRTAGARPGQATAVSRLLVGQQLSFARDPSATPVRSAIAGTDGWTRGMLAFDDTRLGDAVAAANRYSVAKIVVADAALNERRVTGAYRTGDVAGLAVSLATSLHLRAVTTPRGDVVILGARARR